jgi:proline dehydrogenase
VPPSTPPRRGARGRPGVGTTDPRLVAIAGERAAWNERVLDSWEYVMPWQVRSEQQRRSVTGGYRVRVVLRPGAPVPAARRPEGRA